MSIIDLLLSRLTAEIHLSPTPSSSFHYYLLPPQSISGHPLLFYYHEHRPNFASYASLLPIFTSVQNEHYTHSSTMHAFYDYYSRSGVRIDSSSSVPTILYILLFTLFLLVYYVFRLKVDALNGRRFPDLRVKNKVESIR